MTRRRAAGAVLAALAVLVTSVAPARAVAAGPRAGAVHLPPRVPARDRAIFRRAIAIAETSPAVARERRKYPGLEPRTFAYDDRGASRLDVYYAAGGTDRLNVIVDLKKGRPVEAWTGIQVYWQLARGYPGDLGRKFNAPYVWLPLGLAFLLPFFDPRRPFRLLHLDLLVLLGFAISHFFFNAGKISLSTPLVYPVLGYLLVRMLVAGLRPRSRAGPLVPVVPVPWMAAGLIALVALRIGLNVVDSNVLDVGYASVIGAHHVEHGQALYNGTFAVDPPNGDTYGPLTYLLYVPFTAIFGWSGKWDSLPAAHAAAIAFDLLTMVALFFLGRRLRPRARDGTALGVALAYAWASYPYTLLVLNTNTNDALVALFLVLALLAFASPLGRGALIGLGGAAKFASLALAPLFARGERDRGARPYALYALALAAVLVATFAPFIPSGGLREVYDRTLGFQIGRQSPFSLWGLHHSLKPVQLVLKILVVDFALLLLIWPQRRTRVQAAALGAAVVIGLQAASTYWIYLYVVWFLPLVVAALFGEHRRVVREPSIDEAAMARVHR